MNIKHYKNNKGFTLIELIATISLIIIVIALSSTLIIQLIHTDAKMSDQASISQETNVLINELKNQYKNGDFELSYTDDYKLIFPNHSTDNPLQIVDLKIINGKQELSEPGNKINVDTNSPFTITLATKNKQSKTFKIETTWDNIQDFSLSVVLNSGENTNNTCKGFTRLEDFETINDEGELYLDGNNSNNNTCIYNGNIQFTQSSLGPWNFCENTKIQQGNAKFKNQVSLNKVALNVEHNLFAKNKLVFDENANLNIENNARVDGEISFSPGKMSVKNLYAKNKIILHNHSSFHSRCSTRIDGSLSVGSTSEITIGDNLFINSGIATLQENAIVSVNGNASFLNGLTMSLNAQLNIGKNFYSSQDTRLQENIQIETKGDATFGDDLEMMGNAKIKVGRNLIIKNNLKMQADNKIYVDGDVLVLGNVEPDWSKGTICATGKITIDGHVGNEIILKPNNKNCK